MRRLADHNGLRQIQQDMEFMCETVGRRLAGSPEEERVAAYVVERFRDSPLTGHVLLSRGERSALANAASERR